MDDIGGLEIRWAQGFTDKAVDFVDNETVCYRCGSHICFLNLHTKILKVFPSPGRGVSALTASGNSGVFAFSEQRLSPSIFVCSFPELQVKNELKGTAQLDYTSLTLSDGGPYLGCCSSLPDYSITVWNWETAEPICTHPQAGRDVVSLVFNPLNWLQLCTLGTTSITVWNIEKSANVHVLKKSMIQLPAADGSFAESPTSVSQIVSKNLPHFASETPSSTNSGLKGEQAESMMMDLSNRVRLTPSAICWTATSKLYVGCTEGFLLLADPDSLSVSILFNSTTADANPELSKSNFQSLTLNKNGLIAVGEDGVMHCLQIKGTQIDISQTWQLERPVATVKFSPDGETLLLSTSTGQIYTVNPTQSDEVVKVLDVLSGSFVAAALLHNNRDICVSLRQSGDLQLWSPDGVCLGSLSLQVQVTSMACCPIAHYIAVGTASGNILFIDLNEDQQPRVVYQIYLNHTAVDHLVFDQEGHFLLASGSDSHMYVLDARPSKRFEVVGYTVAPGSIVSLSTQCIRDSEKVKVLLLCAGQGNLNHDGELLLLLSLPATNLKETVDRHGGLSSEVLKATRYKVPHPLKSCVLGAGEVFAYCQEKKALQRFQLPQDTDASSQQALQLDPQQEERAHPLGPASLLLSPHGLWLASVGRDGLLRLRETASLERYVELQCHSCRLGGVGSVSFSPDSLTLLTTGFADGSLVCSNLRAQGVDADKVGEATQYSRRMAENLKDIFNTENPVLAGFPVWGFAAGIKKQKEIEVSGRTSADMAEQDESASRLCAAHCHPTWLESRREAVIKEDNEKYFETKRNLRETIKELRDAIQQMAHENEDLPEQHFNLNAEEQSKYEAMVEQEVTRVRAEIKQDILEKCYLYDVLKRECWDSVKVKGRVIKAFHSDLKVQNYPLRERTQKELEELRRVENIGKLEMAAATLSDMKPEEQREEQHGAAESVSLAGSFSAQLGHSNPFIYDQFCLITTEQRINQIILLQDVIYCIKTAFNSEFEALHRQKVQELKRLSDRNRRVRELMLQLDIDEELWEPGMADSECPERLLTVEDSEIKAEKYLTPEQKEEEERRKLEELTHLAAQEDASRGRALDDMMEGVLQVKKEDILKKEIPPPECVLPKTEEEKKAYKEYEKKVKELSEEKETYRRSLETEVKKLQNCTMDATHKIDETLTKLLEKKEKYVVAIYQEELKITYLVESVLMEEEMNDRELEIKLKLEKMELYKDEIVEEVKRQEEEVKVFHEAYDCIVAEDKILDKDFRKDFFDVPNSVVDALYKLFKRRPRVQKMRAQVDINPSLLKEHRLCASLPPDALGKMLKAMEDLDSPENMPGGLNPSIWERFCAIRRTKVESEHQVKLKALTLAEMQAFLQRRRDEEKAAEQEIKNLSEALESVHREKNRLLTDTMVQVILKQGQVELSATDLTVDYTDLILYHRSVVDHLRKQIRMLGEEKIATMVKRKDVRKGTIQLEWEHKVLRKKIEDLHDKARNIKMLRLSEEQRHMTHLSKKDQNSEMSKQVSTLEKHLALMKKTHLKSVQQLVRNIERINRSTAKKAEENALLEQQLLDMQLKLAQLRHSCKPTAFEDNEEARAEERMQEIAKMSKLKEVARAQEQTLALLRAEVERLTRRNFPSLDQLKHN
ncbi:cilia- and flagella-associated protein 43 [Salarias fasciatus]|uniref:cilia- and flagella-associated protein 43 n=1 Tax=Salarias fasciatus TaxID=181472 RepID=UPI0011765D3F|nr:cilia- and flagella-associated protein 43 [Salarias fasciatus]